MLRSKYTFILLQNEYPKFAMHEFLIILFVFLIYLNLYVFNPLLIQYVAFSCVDNIKNLCVFLKPKLTI